MNEIPTGQHPVSLGEYIHGTAIFNKLVLSDSRTYLGMLRAFTSTVCGRVSHALLNQQQDEKHSNAPVIVSFAPGFQLDAQAYPQMIHAFNSQNVPVFTSPSLPQGFKALRYNEHPLNLTKALATFMNQLAQDRPNTKIIALGHSYGAAQQAHAWDMLASNLQSRVIPVTYQGMLSDVGVMGCALPHSPLYPIPRDIFRGKDPFLADAHKIMSGNSNALFGFDPNDGYMDQRQQLGDIPVDDGRVLILDAQDSSGHYGDSLPFAQDFVSRVLATIEQR